MKYARIIAFFLVTVFLGFSSVAHAITKEELVSVIQKQGFKITHQSTVDIIDIKKEGKNFVIISRVDWLKAEELLPDLSKSIKGIIFVEKDNKIVYLLTVRFYFFVPDKEETGSIAYGDVLKVYFHDRVIQPDELIGTRANVMFFKNK